MLDDYLSQYFVHKMLEDANRDLIGRRWLMGQWVPFGPKLTKQKRAVQRVSLKIREDEHHFALRVFYSARLQDSLKVLPNMCACGRTCWETAPMLLRFLRFLAGKCSLISDRSLKQISIQKSQMQACKNDSKEVQGNQKLDMPMFQPHKKMQHGNDPICFVVSSRLSWNYCRSVCVCAHLPKDPCLFEAHRDVLTRQMWQKNAFAVLGRRDWFGNPSVMHVSSLVDCAWKEMHQCTKSLWISWASAVWSHCTSSTWTPQMLVKSASEWWVPICIIPFS